MQLIDEARAEELFGDMGPTTVISGGSGANTAAGVASFGVKAGFIGKVKDDETGQHLRSRSEGHRRPLRRRSRRGRTGYGPQLHSGDARRRAHHEHLSGRLPEPHPGRCQSRHRQGLVHRLSRRLSVGSAGRKGSVPQGRQDRPRGRQQGRADALRRLLRRPLSRRVPRPHARRQPRHPVRQHPRAAEPLRRVRSPTPRLRPCARRTSSAS